MMPPLLLGLASLLGAEGTARGDADEFRITLELPEALHVGDRFEVVALVSPPGEASHPLLLTPSSEGTAVEMVRGRLMRSDADDPSARPLRFRIPAVARAAGDSLLRVHVLTYRCDESCHPVEAEAVGRVRALRR